MVGLREYSIPFTVSQYCLLVRIALRDTIFLMAFNTLALTRFEFLSVMVRVWLDLLRENTK